MPVVRESTTAVVVRGERITQGFASEPYEAGWASEAIVFLTGMDSAGGGTVSVQISPDGMHWIDEGTTITLAILLLLILGATTLQLFFLAR